jgi:hypothetical protein
VNGLLWGILRIHHPAPIDRRGYVFRRFLLIYIIMLSGKPLTEEPMMPQQLFRNGEVLVAGLCRGEARIVAGH